jgi:hypothetical protein
VTKDRVDLDRSDFRRVRSYLAPHLFADGGEGTSYPPPSDLIPKEKWTGLMDLPTDVALRTSSYDGSVIARLADLHSDWIFSWPDVGDAPYMEEPALLAGEEFDALVFNAVHGYYRQAIGCLRNALEILTVAAGLAVTNNQSLYTDWRNGKEITYGQAVAWLRDSPAGKQINNEAAPIVVFGKDDTAWAKARYAQLCGYAHSRAGYNNADFWASNGPVYVPSALGVIETEFRETLALAYLLVRLGWPTFKAGHGQPNLLAGAHTGWDQYIPLLTVWLR